DGTIAKNVAHQYPAGWDWIQPIHDRNTGIWDKVFIEKTHSVRLKSPHIVTKVPGKRHPNEKQNPAQINVSVTLENAADHKVSGVVKYTLAGTEVQREVSLDAHNQETVHFPVFELTHPKLWWPNGYGPQNLYTLKVQFEQQ